MKKVLSFCQKIENFIVVITFAIMVIAIFAQVVNRNISQVPISGFEEAAKYSMVYMVLLGTEMGLRDGTQIAVTSVVDKMKKGARKAFRVIAKLFVILFSLFMTYEGIAMVRQQIASGQTSPGLHMPMYVPYAAIPISFAIIICVQAAAMIAIIKGADEEPEELEEVIEKQAEEIEETLVEEEEVKKP